MIITGTFSEIKEKIDCFFNSIEDTFPYPLNVDISFSYNDREIVLFSKANPHIPCTDISNLDKTSSLYLIDKDTYNLLVGSPNSLDAHMISSPYSLKQKKKQNAKTESSKSKTEEESKKTYTLQAQYKNIDNFSNISNNFIIEEFISDQECSKRPCALAIKQIGSNEYLAFYRSSIYNKGADTTFRHYLAGQPGTLVAYTFFMKISNLKDLFSSMKLSLHKNGKNWLSLQQAEHIMDCLSAIKVY